VSYTPRVAGSGATRGLGVCRRALTRHRYERFTRRAGNGTRFSGVRETLASLVTFGSDRVRAGL